MTAARPRAYHLEQRVVQRRARRVLLLVALLTVPLPYYLGGFEVAPVARLAFLSGLIGGVAITEGSVGFQGFFIWLALAQLAIGLLLLWLAARVVVALVATFAGRRVVAVIGVLCVALGIASLFPIYRTELSSHAARSSLADLLD